MTSRGEEKRAALSQPAAEETPLRPMIYASLFAALVTIEVQDIILNLKDHPHVQGSLRQRIYHRRGLTQKLGGTRHRQCIVCGDGPAPAPPPTSFGGFMRFAQ